MSEKRHTYGKSRLKFTDIIYHCHTLKSNTKPATIEQSHKQTKIGVWDLLVLNLYMFLLYRCS